MGKLFSEKNLNKAKTINPINKEDTSKTVDEKKGDKVKEKPIKTVEKEEKPDDKKESHQNKETNSETNKTKEKENTKKANETIQESSKKVEVDNRLTFAFNDKKRPLFIPESSRYLNSLVLGLKGTGKTTGILPFFVEQDLKNKKVGVTVFVTKQEMSYTIYTLAKQYKRKIIFIKPSIDNEIANKFLFKTEYDYDYIDTNIICYKEAIKNKSIVIVDMENLKYKSESIKICAMLLLQLQLDIQETDLTNRTPHFLYLDDAQLYLPFIKYLLQYSDNYNLGITLFMNSRNQFENYQELIDNNIRNIFLLNSLTLQDINYYNNKFVEQEFNLTSNRSSLNIIYEVVDSQYNKRFGSANYKRFSIEEMEDIEKKSKKHRMKLLKEKRTKQELALRDNLKETIGTKSVKGEPIPIDENILLEDKIMDFTSETEEEIAKKEQQEHDEIRTQIIEEEKEQKRDLAEKAFNKMNSKIDYCNDDFDFEW